MTMCVKPKTIFLCRPRRAMGRQN